MGVVCPAVCASFKASLYSWWSWSTSNLISATVRKRCFSKLQTALQIIKKSNPQGHYSRRKSILVSCFTCLLSSFNLIYQVFTKDCHKWETKATEPYLHQKTSSWCMKSNSTVFLLLMQLFPAMRRKKGRGWEKGGRKRARESTMSVSLTGINALLTFFLLCEDLFSSKTTEYFRESNVIWQLNLNCVIIYKRKKNKIPQTLYYLSYFQEIV